MDGNKKLEFKLQCYFEEYRTLREEILLRIRLRQNLTNYATLMFAALLSFGVGVFFKENGINISENMQLCLFSIIPWFFYPLALLYLRHDLLIAALACYIDQKVSPKIEKLFNI